MTNSRYAAHYDEVHGVVEIRKIGAELAEYQLELSEDEVAEHINLGKWRTYNPIRFSRHDQSFPQLMAKLIEASEAEKIRL